MPRQYKKKILKKKKTMARSKRSRAMPLNNNALNENQSENEIFHSSSLHSRALANVILYLESIGNSIINEIKGLEYAHLEQQFSPSSSIPNATTTQRDFQEILTDIHAPDDQTTAVRDNDDTPIEKSKGRSRGTNSENEAEKKSVDLPQRTMCTRSLTLNRLKNPPQE